MPISPAAPMAPVSPGASYAGYPGMQAGMQAPASPLAPVATNGQQGFSANQLIDPNALPDWMKGQDGGAGAAQPGGTLQPGASSRGQFSASDLIDPSALPSWVSENEPAAPQAYGASAAMSPVPAMPAMSSAAAMAMPPDVDIEPPRERTSRVAAPRPAMREQPGQDFGASRAGTGRRAVPPRANPTARPLDNHEKPTWLREDFPDAYGRDNMAAPPSARPNGRRDRTGGWDGHEDQPGYDQGYEQLDQLDQFDPYEQPSYDQGMYDQGGYGAASQRAGRNGQNGQYGRQGRPGQTGRTARVPAGQTGQSWAAPDGYEPSPWSRPRPPRPDEKAAPKKRKGGFFGFLRRG